MKVTVTLTTCGRIDLLQQTIDSFLERNTYPIDEFLIINDSPDHSSIISELYSDSEFHIINNPENIGQKKSLDLIFNQCKNEYIFHLEDDWLFDGGGGFVENSVKLLEFNPDIHQVWIRHEYDNPHKCVGTVLYENDIGYKLVDPMYQGVWNGYSWNPGIRRKSDYLRMFPNGISDFKDEMACAIHTRNFEYKTVLLIPTACRHLGYGRTSQ